MTSFTLEKIHALLEKLAEYVMTELPTRKEMDEKLASKADKTDVERLERRVNRKIEGMDAQAKRLEPLTIDDGLVNSAKSLRAKRSNLLPQRTSRFLEIASSLRSSQ